MSDQADARTQMCRILDCRGWNENGTHTTPTHSWLRYRPFSLEDLPPAVLDVELGNDELRFRFLVRANSPDPWFSLSLSLSFYYTVPLVVLKNSRSS